jgi:Tfp pilus assembly protein PilF
VGKFNEALADCNKALELRANNASAFDSRAFAYLKMGQLDKAISDYDAALQISPTSGSILYGRGLTKLKKGDTAGGNADIEAAKVFKLNIAVQSARYGVK